MVGIAVSEWFLVEMQNGRASFKNMWQFIPIKLKIYTFLLKDKLLDIHTKILNG